MKESLRSLAGYALAALTLHSTPGWSCGTGSDSFSIMALPAVPNAVVQVNGLNSAGQVTGFFYVPNAQAAHAFRYDQGILTDLGTLGGAMSEGLGLNSQGLVMGYGTTANGQFHAFVTGSAGLVDLGSLGGGFSSPSALNDAGQIVGYSFTANFALRGFVYASGTMTNLGDLGGGSTFPYVINDSGVIAGESATASGDSHAFVDAKGQMTDLGTLGGSYSAAYALNDAGLIVGEASIPSGQTHAFVCAAGVMTDLGTLGGTTSSAFMVNSNGQVIGYATTPNDAETHGFAFAGGSLVDLGTLGGTSSMAFANNNRGQIVGYATAADASTNAFIWENGAMKDLNTLLPANSGWRLVSAQFINDAGRIVGVGVLNGVPQPFILDPAAGNIPPIAIAGPDQTVACPGQVTLDGSQSIDPDKDTLSFQWSIAGNVLGTNEILTVSLPLGTNVVTLKVADPCGAVSQTNVCVTVVDTTPPVITALTAQPRALQPEKKNRLVPLTVLVSASDACNGATVSKIISIRGDRKTKPGEIQITGPLAANLAASHDAAEDGQVYTITVQCTDASGNTSQRNLKVPVTECRDDDRDHDRDGDRGHDRD